MTTPIALTTEPWRALDRNSAARRARLATLVADVERPPVGAGNVGALQEPTDEWTDDIDLTTSHRTVPPTWLGNTAVLRKDQARITGRHLDDFYRELHLARLASSAAHKHHCLIHTSLGRAVKWGVLPSNPPDRATPPRLARHTAGRDHGRDDHFGSWRAKPSEAFGLMELGQQLI